MVGDEGDGGLVMRYGLGHLALLQELIGEVVVGFGQAGFEVQGSLVAGRRPVSLAFWQEGVAQDRWLAHRFEA